MTGRLIALALAVLAVGAAAVAAWPSPRHGVAGSRAVSAPVVDAARVPRFVSDSVANVRLGQRLDAVLAGRPQSCLTVDEGRGMAVYSERPDLPLLPASNLKLLTATALLARIPASERLHTEIRAVSPPVNGVIAGDLWLVGAGDPLLATADFAAQAGYQHQPRPATPLEDLANKLAAAGVRQVQGRILGDESRYDAQRVVPTWSPSYLADGEIGPMSALTVNDNEAQWTPKEVPAPSPAANATGVLARLLQMHGVQVGGTGEGVAPPTATNVVTAVDSAPIADLVGVMLTQSDNLAAELLTKELGRRFGGAGTTAAGISVIRSELDQLHMPTSGVAMADGSGLDRSDRATCQVLLSAVERDGEGATIARLPVAGMSGTLFHRYVGSPLKGRLWAKTGTLSGAAAFTGWVSTAQSRQLAFSFLVNGIGSEAEGHALEDHIAAALATYPEAPPWTALTGDVQ
jgi:D-alanyl-D-alanine carboxypeptidase/D-alanyl-D-alanine-endopeptidase (penicillin-binding protein 4)